MSFGRNPHVAKAEAAEQKAKDARDALAHAQAWREAARQWERAALREKSDKLRAVYTEKADAARMQADSPAEPSDTELEAESEGNGDEDTMPVISTQRSKLLN